MVSITRASDFVTVYWLVSGVDQVADDIEKKHVKNFHNAWDTHLVLALFL